MRNYALNVHVRAILRPNYILWLVTINFVKSACQYKNKKNILHRIWIRKVLHDFENTATRKFIGQYTKKTLYR